MTSRLVASPITARPWRSRRWLVLAPHPDDETLGAGALIAQTAATGRLAAIVYLTDGSGSHPVQDDGTGRIIATREREAKLALRRLVGVRSNAPLFLRWKDGSPEPAGSPVFERSCRKLAALCVRLRVDVLATTAPQEPHCDHVAAAELALAVQAVVKRRLTIAEYVVWGAPVDGRTHRTLITEPMMPGMRRRALAAHRSQLTASSGVGFRLPRDKCSMAARDLLYVRRR